MERSVQRRWKDMDLFLAVTGQWKDAIKLDYGKCTVGSSIFATWLNLKTKSQDILTNVDLAFVICLLQVQHCKHAKPNHWSVIISRNLKDYAPRKHHFSWNVEGIKSTFWETDRLYQCFSIISNCNPQNNQVATHTKTFPQSQGDTSEAWCSVGNVGALCFSVDGAAVGLELEKVFQRSHCSRVAVSCDSYLINLD